MIQKKILLLATYPIKNPQHGGQKRVDALVRLYKKHFASVKFSAIFYGGFYSSYSKDDIALKGESRKKIEVSPFTGDLISGEALYKDTYARKKIIKLLTTYKPDIIEIEQTFPYAGLKKILSELNINPPIILSSHNIESDMKEEMLRGMGMPVNDRVPVVKAIGELEKELTKRAQLVIAVTEEDATWHRANGAKKIVVAPNGIAPIKPTSSGVKYWNDYKKSHNVNRLVTFVAAAHPPNWNGFLAMVGKAVGFIPPDTKLLLAGSIADYFKDNVNNNEPLDNTFWQRAVPVGRLSEERLAGLLASTDVLLLPIIEGGGSNLKTAEAILSGKKVVATNFAFRSYEQYLQLPNLFIADTAEEFQQAIVRALNEPLKERTSDEKVLAQKVTWKFALQPIEKELQTL